MKRDWNGVTEKLINSTLLVSTLSILTHLSTVTKKCFKCLQTLCSRAVLNVATSSCPKPNVIIIITVIFRRRAFYY